MSRTADLWITTKQGSELAGTITLADGGEFTTHAEPGYEILMQNAMNRYHMVGNRPVYREQEPELWFESLPLHFRGSAGGATIRKT